MDIQQLFELGEPYMFLVEVDPSDFANLYLRLQRERPGGVIRMVRGKRSRDVAGFYDEVAAVLQFPYYFGGNTAAFNDCMTDLEWAYGDAYVLMLDDAHLFLEEDDEAAFTDIVRQLAEVGEAWLTPNEFFPRDRNPTPFAYLLRCDVQTAEDFASKLSQSGIAFAMI